MAVWNIATVLDFRVCCLIVHSSDVDQNVCEQDGIFLPTHPFLYKYNTYKIKQKHDYRKPKIQALNSHRTRSIKGDKLILY